MHPPFGFALFYLRSVAPRDRYRDKITGRTMDGITTGQIYWGAVPFVAIQIIMVALAIAFPQLIMHYKDTGPADPSKIEVTIPPTGAPGDLGQPPLFDLGTPPQVNP
jgi:hypothetical protein